MTFFKDLINWVQEAEYARDRVALSVAIMALAVGAVTSASWIIGNAFPVLGFLETLGYAAPWSFGIVAFMVVYQLLRLHDAHLSD